MRGIHCWEVAWLCSTMPLLKLSLGKRWTAWWLRRWASIESIQNTLKIYFQLFCKLESTTFSWKTFDESLPNNLFQVGHAAGIAADFARVFPQTKHMYMYRHPCDYLRSVRSVFYSVFHPVFRTLALMISYQVRSYRENKFTEVVFQLTCFQNDNAMQYHLNRFCMLWTLS